MSWFVYEDKKLATEIDTLAGTRYETLMRQDGNVEYIRKDVESF